MDDLHIGAEQASSQRGSQSRVDLHRGELLDGPAQDVGRHARTWPNLKDVAAQLPRTHRPGQNLRPNGLSPLRARTDLQVLFIHETASLRAMNLPSAPPDTARIGI